VEWVTGWLRSDLCGVRNCIGGCDVDLVVWVTIRVSMKWIIVEWVTVWEGAIWIK
jgi:hypothetical protein